MISHENKKFIETVTQTWGQKGVSWLEDLPSIIDKLAQYWNLNEIIEIDNLSYNYVAYAIQDNENSVVLKICCDKSIFNDECRALLHFNGCGSVKLLDSSEQYQAMLLEKIVPGNLLSDDKKSNMNEAMRAYSKIVNSISAIHNNNLNDFTHMRKWCDVIDEINDSRIKEKHIEMAKKIRNFLFDTVENEYVCHGDLHLENIIQQNDHWVSIDPKGIIGEKAFEAAAFDLLSEDELELLDDIQEIIDYRVKALSSELNIPFNRLLYWIFLRLMISAQWFIEDNGIPTVVLKVIDLIYPLIVSNLKLN